MAKFGTKATLATLVLIAIILIAALVRETSRNPSFRAEDFGSLGECIAGIPETWLPGSVERTGAETACRYVHAPRESGPRTTTP